MAFIEVIRGKWGGQFMPNGVVRLNKDSIVISPDIAEQFQLGRTTTEHGNETVKIGLAVDKDAKQIKLIPNPVNGFSWVNTLNTNTNALRSGVPGQLRKMALERGDYQVVDKKNLIFQLAQ